MQNSYRIPILNPLPTIASILKIPVYFLFFIFVSSVFFLFLIAVPAYTIPGNTFAFEIELLTNFDFVTLVILSSLTSATTTLHLYFYRNSSHNLAGKAAGNTLVSAFSGLVASIFGTASCGACVASIFGFLGFGTVLLLLKYRHQIIFIAIALNLMSIYSLTRKINGYCKI